MARTHFALLCAALLLASACAQDATPKVSVQANAAAGAAGDAAGKVVEVLTAGKVPSAVTGVVASNALLAADSAKNVHAASTKLVGGLLAKSLDAKKSFGAILINIVNAVNSLNIAGLNLAAGVTNSAVGALVNKIRGEALIIGNIYTELLGEFGRFVGGSITAVNTLKRGLGLSPLELGVNHLEKSLNSLIVFLQALVSPSVSGPGRAAVLAPFIGTLKAVKGLLDALDKAIKGPGGNVLHGLDGGIGAAAAVLGGGPLDLGKGGIGDLIGKALGLMKQIPGL